MSELDEGLEHVVDQVLRAAWPRERWRAKRRLWNSALRRWGVAMAFLGLLVAVFALAGAPLPWAFLAVMGSLTALAVVPGRAEQAHLDGEPAPDQDLHRRSAGY